MRNLLSRARRPVRRFDERYAAWLAGLSQTGQRAHAAVLGVGLFVGANVVLGMLTPTVAAQTGTAAEDVMCQTGAGDAVTFLFGGLALLLLIVAGLRVVSGLNKKGSQNKQKIQEGDAQVKGGAYSLGGVFVLTAFPLILEQIGLATISCVTFSPF